MPRGGRRPGAGRKPNAIALPQKDELRQLVDTHWPLEERGNTIRRLVSLANAKIPNLKAAEILLAYAYGKPTERHEITGADGGPVEFADASATIKRRLARLAAVSGAGEVPAEPDAD